MAHAKKQRRKENREPVCVMLGAERWVSLLVVNRADARGGVWDVAVVEEIIGRPLQHTLPIVESQQAVSSVVQCPSLLHPPRPLLPPKLEKTGRGNHGCRFDGIGHETSGDENS
jgi:hypothetical protein